MPELFDLSGLLVSGLQRDFTGFDNHFYALGKKTGQICWCEKLSVSDHLCTRHIPDKSSSGTQFASGRGDNPRLHQYSKHQAVRYEKKRYVGSQDKVTSA